MVYVDDMFDVKKYGKIGQFGRMKMSHMMADTKEELLAMADKIGVQRKWIQKEGTSREHFDVCMSHRKKAIEFGAKAITYREMGELVK
jgi:hypothetical protein